jgi:hypothetical protein
MMKRMIGPIIFLFLIITNSTWAIRTCPKKNLKMVRLNTLSCEYRGKVVKQDPLSGKFVTIPFTYYFSRLPDKKAPLVLVYPSLSQEIPIVETIFSKKLVQNGFHALVVELVENISDLNRRPQEINDFFIRSNWATQILIDLAQTWVEVDDNDINAAGVSLGGIRATLAYGEDLRIKRLITYVTGGNLPEIFATSKVKLMTNYKEHWKQKLNLKTDQEYLNYLQRILTVDPLNIARIRTHKNIYMVLAQEDEKVPFKNQLELLHALKYPPHRISQFAHRITGASFLSRFNEVVWALQTPLR